MRDPKKWAYAALALGLAVLALSFRFTAMHLRSAQPLGHDYGGEAILAFELADSPQALARVIGADPPDADAQAIRAAMDAANRLDFIYMALYGPFIACACIALALRTQRRWLYAGALLGPLAALCDRAENLALLALTQPGADLPALLAQLHLRTWAKWELLALASALFAAGFIARGHALRNLGAGGVALLCIAGGVLGYADAPRYAVLMLYGNALVWLWQTVFAARVSFGRTA